MTLMTGFATAVALLALTPPLVLSVAIGAAACLSSHIPPPKRSTGALRASGGVVTCPCDLCCERRGS